MYFSVEPVMHDVDDEDEVRREARRSKDIMAVPACLLANQLSLLFTMIGCTDPFLALNGMMLELRRDEALQGWDDRNGVELTEEV